MSTAERLTMSAEEYLAWEAQQETKHEFLAGLVYEVYAKVGARDAHVTVAGNAFALLKNHLRGTPCRTYISDMKLQVQGADAWFYSDVFVTCDERDRASEYSKSFPVLVIEVLSPSTADYDRGGKFAIYRKIETLQEYALIDPGRRSVDLFRRDGSGHWVLYPSDGESEIDFASIDLRAALADLFEDVEPPATDAARPL
jgi:Uma2 family endonuclease